MNRISRIEEEGQLVYSLQGDQSKVVSIRKSLIATIAELLLFTLLSPRTYQRSRSRYFPRCYKQARMNGLAGICLSLTYSVSRASQFYSYIQSSQGHSQSISSCTAPRQLDSPCRSMVPDLSVHAQKELVQRLSEHTPQTSVSAMSEKQVAHLLLRLCC